MVETDSGLVTSVKREIAEDMQARNTDQDMVQFMHKSTAVDPRFKSLAHVAETSRTATFTALEDSIHPEGQQQPEARRKEGNVNLYL